MSPRHIVTALAIVFFGLPMGLLAAGVRAHPFENRPLAGAPSADAGWDVFAQTTRYFTDAMPLREQAVRAQGWASRNVLDVPPAWRRDLISKSRTAGLPQAVPAEPQGPVEQRAAPGGGSRVLEGRQGWLFLGDELQLACTPTIPWAVAVQRMQRLATAIRASGRDIVIAVPPDKSVVYPELLTDDTRTRYACAEQSRRAYWPLLEQAGPQILALRAPLLAAKARYTDPLYRSTDSHWNTLGAGAGLQAILGRLDSGGVRIRDDELVPRAPLTYTGDLTTLLGETGTSTTPDRAIRRRPSARKLTGRTLFIADSYGDYDGPLLGPYAENLVLRPWPSTPTATAATAVRAADHVIIQVVEREVPLAFADDGLLSKLSAALEARLPSKP
jgi:hypothetical protein